MATHDHGPGSHPDAAQPAGHSNGPRSALESYAHVQGGPPVLDIGGDVGALVVTVPRQRLGTELHLRSVHDPPISIHTGVWQRRLGSGVTVAAVFAELVEGTYWILDDDGNRICRVEITGGALTAIDLREG
jgi:hypothetical protein